jgi:hypothetical protein
MAFYQLPCFLSLECPCLYFCLLIIFYYSFKAYFYEKFSQITVVGIHLPRTCSFMEAGTSTATLSLSVLNVPKFGFPLGFSPPKVHPLTILFPTVPKATCVGQGWTFACLMKRVFLWDKMAAYYKSDLNQAVWEGSSVGDTEKGVLTRRGASWRE